MAINLMELLKDQVLGGVAGQLGSHLGESEEATRGGLDALLPTVLGGLVKNVSEPGGADKLNEALDSDDYDGGLLEKFGGMLSGGNSEGISSMGSGLVSMIFGDKIGSILGIISKLTGLGGKSTSGLLGLALPLIMSFLGKQKRSMGLDANGLSQLLMDQKEHIGAALPPGIGEEMGLGALGIKSPEPTSAPAPSTATAPEGGGLAKLLIPVALIGILGFAAYKFLGGNGEPEKENPAIENVEDDLLNIDMGTLEVPGLAEQTTKLTDSFGGLKDLLGGITDVDSAKAKLQDLQSADEGLGKITSGLSAAPEGMKSGLIKAAAGLIPGLQEMIDKVMAIPGVSTVLKPVMDSLQEKLGMLAG